MKPYESQSAFLGIVDTRDSRDRIIHAFRVTSILLDISPYSPKDTRRVRETSLLQDLIESNQGLTAQGCREFYEKMGIDLDKCLSVETNFRIGDKAPEFNGLPISQAGYIAVFQFFKQQGGLTGDKPGAIFAHLNRSAIFSLAAVGLEYRNIVARQDLKTPTVGPIKFDPDYSPVEIPPTDKNIEIFEALSAFATPNIYY